MAIKQRAKGEVYRPNAKVLKLKGETPSCLKSPETGTFSTAGQTLTGVAGNNMRIAPGTQRL